MGTPAYERDPYLAILETEVVAVLPGSDSATPEVTEVVLADTLLYPEGGGQPSDRGSVNGAQVLDVRRTPEGIVHVLSEAIPLGAVTVRLDWTRRYDHMQQHTGQHLLTAVAEERFSWSTTAFHLGAEVSDIELAVAGLTDADLRALEEAVAEEIRRARPVRPRRVTRKEFEHLHVRTRGLPEDLVGDIRLIEIEGVDLNTCGGTHLRSTAEIEAIALLGTESIRGGTRLFFVAGGRVRRRLTQHESRNAVLRSVLGVPDGEIAETLRVRMGAMEQASRSLRKAEEELADLHGDLLAARALRASDGVVDAHFDNRDGGFLQRCARRFASACPAGMVFLTSSNDGGALFVLAAGAERVGEVGALAGKVAVILEGRGGGAGGLFQGKAQSLARREQAVLAIRGMQ